MAICAGCDPTMYLGGVSALKIHLARLLAPEQLSCLSSFCLPLVKAEKAVWMEISSNRHTAELWVQFTLCDTVIRLKYMEDIIVRSRILTFKMKVALDFFIKKRSNVLFGSKLLQPLYRFINNRNILFFRLTKCQVCCVYDKRGKLFV